LDRSGARYGASMSLVFDTGSMAPEERFEGWQEAAARCFFPMAIRGRAVEPFSGRMVGHELPSIDVVRVTATPNDCLRTPEGIAARDPEQLQLHVLRRGRCEISQDDRRDILTEGSLTTLDSSRPWAIRAVEPFELLVLAVPKVLLRPFGDALTAGTARTIPGDAGLGSLIVPFALGLADRLEDGSLGDGRDELGETLVGLLRALAVDGGERRAAPTPALLMRVKAHIERHLGDPALRPGSIAAAHFITTRYLHRLFETEGCTVSEWIRRARLERCRRDLADPALAGDTILAIATRWGMPDGAHFSRMFRAAHGMSPREFRALSAAS
jgi:AraC-like DNA-binding protein